MNPHEIANGQAPIPGISPAMIAVPPQAMVDVVGPNPHDEDEVMGHEAATRPEFEWTSQGLAVWARGNNGERVRVHFPLHQIDLVFQRETARVGCPLGPTVGDYSVGGLFKKIGRGIKKAARTVTRPVTKTLSKSKFGRGILSAGDRILKTAGKVAKGVKTVVRSKAFRGVLAGAAVAFPAIAPGVAALEAAQQVMDRVEKGKKAVEKIAKGVDKAAATLTKKKADESAEIMATAFENAQKGDRDAMEMVGAWNEVVKREKTKKGQKGRKRAARIARRKAAKKSKAQKEKMGKMRGALRRSRAALKKMRKQQKERGRPAPRPPAGGPGTYPTFPQYPQPQPYAAPYAPQYPPQPVFDRIASVQPYGQPYGAPMQFRGY